MRRSIGGTTLALALITVACGGGSGSNPSPVARSSKTSQASPTPAETASPAPDWGRPEPFPHAGSLPKSYTSIPEMNIDIALSGKWRTSMFLPPFSFDAPHLAFPFTARADAPDFVYLTSNDPQAVAFARPNGVFANGTKVVDVPGDLAAWLHANPYLRTGAVTAISLGGLSGVEMDAVVASIPSPQPSFCTADGLQCLPVATSSDGPILYLKGEKVRFIVLHAGGAQMLLSIEALPTAFPVFATSAEQLLRSVRFQGV
jgi:hypothetical protein